MKQAQKKNVKIHSGILKNLRMVIIVSTYNKKITDSLLKYCEATLRDNGVQKKNIKTVYVPGALEIPVTAKLAAKNLKPDCIIALGCVIKGDTYHFEVVVDNCSAGCQQVALEYGIPVINEVLACNNVKQAQQRSGDNNYNKGIEAATTALKMAKICSVLKNKQ